MSVDSAPDSSEQLKRVFDAFASVPAIVVLSPLALIIAVAIRIESKGPVIFRQKRVGKNGNPFVLYKFRSMRVETDDVPTHLVPASSLTRTGGLIRRLKLDELPQLLNVVKGDMSLVGPRPCLPSQTELIGHRRALGVLTLRPGITGPAQVVGIDMSDPELLARTDAEYLGCGSIGYDLKCILATVSGGGSGDRIRTEASA